MCVCLCVCVWMCVYFPGGSDGKESAAIWRLGFSLWFGKILWRREWLLTPVFLPGEFHGQMSLMGYSPWGSKLSDMTEWLSLTKVINSTFHIRWGFPNSRSVYLFSYRIFIPDNNFHNRTLSSYPYTRTLLARSLASRGRALALERLESQKHLLQAMSMLSCFVSNSLWPHRL